MNRRKIGIFSMDDLSKTLKIKMSESLFIFRREVEQSKLSKENLEDEITEILNKVIELQKVTELSIDENNVLGKEVGNDLELELSYTGERELFELRASQQKFGAPEVILTNTSIIYIVKDYIGKDINAAKDFVIKAIKMRIEFTNRDIKEFNKNLEIRLKEEAEIVKQEIMKKIETLENSGIKIVK